MRKMRLHQQRVGAGRARAVDVGDLDDEVVYAASGMSCALAVLRAHRCASSLGVRAMLDRTDFCMSQAAVGQRSAHRPQCTQRSSSLTMTRPVCLQRRRRRTAPARMFGAGAFSRVRSSASVAVRRDGEAVDRADVDAGVALDAELVGEHGLHVAVEAALHLLGGLLGGEAQLDLDVELLEALLEARRAASAGARRGVVVVACTPTRACPSCGVCRFMPSAAGARRRTRPGSACGSRSRPGGRARPPR